MTHEGSSSSSSLFSCDRPNPPTQAVVDGQERSETDAFESLKGPEALGASWLFTAGLRASCMNVKPRIAW